MTDSNTMTTIRDRIRAKRTTAFDAMLR